jgi:hypothetical protein
MHDIQKRSILFLYDQPPRVADTVHEHVEALVRKSAHDVFPLSVFGELPPNLDLSRFDIILIHYSLIAAHDGYVSPSMRNALGAAGAIKAIFIQDEYRHINRTVAAFREIGIDVLFTCMPDGSIERVYPESALPGVRKVNVLTGYVPEKLLSWKVKPLYERPIDVGYRARKVPAWLGDLGQEKWTIGRRFLADSASYGLICDIAYREEERLYGKAWIDFLCNCKATLGVESGSSVFDFTDEIRRAVDEDVAANPTMTYEELKRRHFADIDEKIDQRQISPRCFEAAALKTLMILYEGWYSGILRPDRHYVALAKDHSNMAEVVSILRDKDKSQAIVEAAYKEIACNPQYHFSEHVKSVDRILAEEFERRSKNVAVPYDRDNFLAASQLRASARRRASVRKFIVYAHYALFRGVFGVLSERHRDRVGVRLGKVFERLSTFAKGLFTLVSRS